MMTIGFGCDHVGFEMKQALMAHVAARGYACRDFGCESAARAEYPVYAELVARAVAAGTCDMGILVCGTGAGMSLAANQVEGIRAVPCSEPYTAALTRRHNDCNVLALGARVVAPEFAKMIVDAWLDAAFEGERHQARVDALHAIRTRA